MTKVGVRFLVAALAVAFAAAIPAGAGFADGGDAGPPGGIEDGTSDPIPEGQIRTDETAPHQEVLEPGYDDSWTANVPQTVEGLEVGYINTPKNFACNSRPLIRLRSTQPTLEQYLADPPDIPAIRKTLLALPGVPTDFDLSFSPAPIDTQASAEWESNWTKDRLQSGCLEPWKDLEIGDGEVQRAYALFQNKDIENYTDVNAQSVDIISPATFNVDENQHDWSAALNNVVTDKDYFLQVGMQVDMEHRKDESSIGYTSAPSGSDDLDPTPFQAVHYKKSTKFWFTVTYTSSSWQMCAARRTTPQQYQCHVAEDAVGTKVKQDKQTSVWFEHKNTPSTWATGFPAKIKVGNAKIYRNGKGQQWQSEDHITWHRCGKGRYPAAGAFEGTLVGGNDAYWILAGVPRVCSRNP